MAKNKTLFLDLKVNLLLLSLLGTDIGEMAGCCWPLLLPGYHTPQEDSSFVCCLHSPFWRHNAVWIAKQKFFWSVKGFITFCWLIEMSTLPWNAVCSNWSAGVESSVGMWVRIVPWFKKALGHCFSFSTPSG